MRLPLTTSRKNHRSVDLISDALPFGWLWYGDANAVANAIGYAEHRSPSYDAVKNGTSKPPCYIGGTGNPNASATRATSRNNSSSAKSRSIGSA